VILTNEQILRGLAMPFTVNFRSSGRGPRAVALALLLACFSSCSRGDPEGDSYANLSRIRLAIHQYREQHQGNWPETLDELVSSYLSSNDLACFFPTI
jgi:hypothetical protein